MKAKENINILKPAKSRKCEEENRKCNPVMLNSNAM
jgi:hypothetical protein